MISSAELLGRDDIGVLKPGACADIVAVPATRPTARRYRGSARSQVSDDITVLPEGRIGATEPR